MLSPGLHQALVWLELVAVAPVLLGLISVNAPYGRHARAGFGPLLPSRPCWILMESPAVAVFAAVYLLGSRRGEPVPVLLFSLWQAHYLHRAVLYPWWMRPGGRMPLLLVALALCFNTVNAYVNARWISEFGEYPTSWLADPRFLAGAALFAGGLALNVWSDRSLRRLRGPGDTAYRVPRGGVFELVSCPNYLGEIAEWTGWALATWSLPGAAFALFTAANLVPRALAHHDWYRERFDDYPPERRALIPFLL